MEKEKELLDNKEDKTTIDKSEKSTEEVVEEVVEDKPRRRRPSTFEDYPKFKLGDKVLVSEDAVWASTGERVPSWVVSEPRFIHSYLGDSKYEIGRRSIRPVIGVIESKYLTKV